MRPQKPRVFTAPPFFVFHYGNMYEEAGPDGRRTLHMDMAAYDDPTIVNDLAIQPLMDARKQVSEAFYQRLSIPLDAGVTTLPVRCLLGDRWVTAG